MDWKKIKPKLTEIVFIFDGLVVSIISLIVFFVFKKMNFMFATICLFICLFGLQVVALLYVIVANQFKMIRIMRDKNNP